ncbi:MAG: MFS transporter [Ignisphaera sp.]
MNKAIVLLATINALLMFISGLTYPLLPLYLVGHKGYSAFISGVVASLSSLTSFVFSIIWGYILNRFRGRETFFSGFGGLVTAIFFSLASFFSNDILLLSIFFSLTGIGASCTLVSSTTLVSLISSSQVVGRSMGVFWAAGSLGWATPLTFSGYFLNRFGIESIFHIAILVSLLIVLLSIALSKYIKDVGNLGNIVRLNSIKRRSFLFLRNRLYLLFFISSIIFGAADVAKNIYVPQYYAYEIRLGEVYATLLLSIASWFEIPMLIAFGYIVDKLGSKIVYIFSLASMAIFMVLNIFIVKDMSTAFATMAFYSIVWGSYASSAYVLAVELAKGDESASLGLLNSSIPLASILYNPLGGYISSSMGYKTNFSFLSLLLVASSVTFYYYYEMRKTTNKIEMHLN